MSSGLVPRYPQERRIGLTLMGEKWLGTTFLFTSLFYVSLHSYVVLSNAIYLSIYLPVHLNRIYQELKGVRWNKSIEKSG